MTITFRHMKPFTAILLSRTEDTLRVAVPGEDDTLVFQCVNGTWISENCEPVCIEFEWQRKKRVNAPAEAECICNEQLAAALIDPLYCLENDELEEQLLHAFAPEVLSNCSGRQYFVS